jgi:hypothetical protein
MAANHRPHGALGLAAGVIVLLALCWPQAAAETVVLDEIQVERTDYWDTLCEYTASGTTHSVNCPASTNIKVGQAFYGAWATSTNKWCNYTGAAIPSCIFDATTKLASKCNGRSECTIGSLPFGVFDQVGYGLVVAVLHCLKPAQGNRSTGLFCCSCRCQC